ncbi:MAG: 2Fe-2S iron-sulfur cluster-binding protein [Oscillospiraceae bacterium]|nr:2Fe-2S iron-sulfur cluster-binding protein [Oscillospiraceae bacterium]
MNDIVITNDIVRLKIKRSQPKPGRFQTYEVPYVKGMTVLTALRYIWENMDSTLAYRNNHCGRGVCMACLVKLNGKVCRACSSQMMSGETYTVEPANDKVIRDLVVEL